jgi:formiminoglutamate deiminase
MTTYWCEYAWLDDAGSAAAGPGGDAVARVRVTEAGGLITAVDRGADPEPDDVRLAGLTLPGFANAHSHAFHRGLRGRTHTGAQAGGSFWVWREAMYALAVRLDPDSYLALARAAYAEMVLAGVTRVGEFHYLHHAPGGTPYADPNAMAEALRQAAVDAGLQLTLLDACYLSGGLGPDGHLPLDPVQRRFADADVDAWQDRFALLKPDDGMAVGAAVHSVRAVPAGALTPIADAVRGRPLHVHLSEQPAENEACQRFYGRTPTEQLDAHGLLGAGTTAVHATHLTPGDIRLLGGSRTTACFCPTTERDLADGIGPAVALRDAGSPLALGSDQHAVVDLIEEARALEMHERLATGIRGRFGPGELVTALTRDGHAALGAPLAGRLAVGAPADLVAVRLDSVRTAGCRPGQAVLAATAADVHTVLVAGREVVSGGEHRALGPVGPLLADALRALDA